MNPNTLRATRQEAVDAMAGLISRADTAGRDLTAQELGEVERLRSNVDVIDAQLDTGASRSAHLTVDNEQRIMPTGTPQEVRVKRSLGPGDSVADQLRARGDQSQEERPGAILAAILRGDPSGLDDHEERALLLNPSSAGGYTASAMTAARVIDQARAELSVFQAGAQTVLVEGESLTIPRLDTDFAATWRAEGGGFADAGGNFGAVTLRPQSLATLAKISIELVEDSAVDLETYVTQALTAVLQGGLERAVFGGTGANNQPTGLELQNDVNLTASVGAISDYGFLINGVTPIWEANGTPNAVIYGPGVAGKVAAFKTGISSDKTPLQPPPALANLRTYVSGNATSGAAYVADWSTVVVGMKPSSIRFQVLRERFAEDGLIGIRADLRADVALMHPEHVSVSTGITVS